MARSNTTNADAAAAAAAAMQNMHTSQMQAKNNPVRVSKTVETAEQQVGQMKPRDMRSFGPAEGALAAPQFEQLVDPNDRPIDNEKIEMERFMQDDLTIRLSPTTDKNAEQIIEVNVITVGLADRGMLGSNSKPVLIPRGKDVVVKRYIVERLLRCKLTGYGLEEKVVNGERMYSYPAATGMRYDFSVIHDPHPRGADWLKYLMAEAG